MRNVNKDNITEVFTGYFGEDTDPRAREILASLAKHLHAFAKEVNLTHEEWRQGLELAQWTGKITTDERNEFVLLSDVLGLSSLVDMLNSRPDATSSSVLGPFHVSNPPVLEIGGDLKGEYDGELLLVEGAVRDRQDRTVRLRDRRQAPARVRQRRLRPRRALTNHYHSCRLKIISEYERAVPGRLPPAGDPGAPG